MAYTAGIGSIFSVDSPVCYKVYFLHEALFAEIVAITILLTVTFFVCFEIGFYCKSLVALSAGIGSFSSVVSLVYYEMR